MQNPPFQAIHVSYIHWRIKWDTHTVQLFFWPVNKVIFWRDRRLWCVTIPRGWKENSGASVCFLQLKKYIIMWPVSPRSHNLAGNYDKTKLWYTWAGPEKAVWWRTYAALLHFPRKWFIKMDINLQQLNCDFIALIRKKTRTFVRFFFWSSIVLLFFFK